MDEPGAARLLDTAVLVDYLRGHEAAARFLEDATGRLLVSAVSVAELYAGVREGREREALHDFVTAFEIAPVDEEVARLGGLVRRDFGPSHGVGLADALVAATAEVAGVRLCTLDRKHFPTVEALEIPYDPDGSVDR